MATNDKDQKPYPEEYAHIKEKVKEIQDKIKNLEKLKETNQGVSQNTLNYTPPGLLPPGILPTKRNTIAQRTRDFDKEIELAKTQGWTEIENTLKGDKSEAAKEIQERVMNELFPNDVLSMEEKDIAKLPEKQKDIEASQNFTQYLRLKSQNKLPVKAEKTETRTIDDSQRFTNQVLTYFKDKKEKGQEEKTVTTKEPKETLKDMSMSAKFSQSLSYTKVMDNPKSDKTPTRDKSDRDRE